MDKIAAQFAYPLGLSLALCILALALLALSRNRLGTASLALAVIWLGFWSLPVVSDVLRQSLESRFPNQPVSDLPPVDAVVVLGGGIRPVPSDWPYPDLGNGADRVWHAARIYHAGKAPLVIIAGGGLPWLGERISEAEAMRRFLLDLGVPGDAILLEERSGNTWENARNTSDIIREQGLDGVLLVTSAQHMPRALAAFQAAGINAVPAATDFEAIPEDNHLLRWLPDSEALADSSSAIKEYLGIWVYRWRGWAEQGTQKSRANALGVVNQL